MTDQSIIRVFPGWRVVREIGAGGFGKVYEIERDRFGKIEKAAVKVMNIPNDRSIISEMREDGYDDESIKSRLKSDMDAFATEYDNMRKVAHANIVNCDDIEYEVNEDGFGYTVYLKMELLTPLMASIKNGYDREKTTISLAKDICKALERCESRNIVHRDIKPQNLFVNEYGEYKLGDFGIAREMDHATNATKTGTYKYMAPEVFNNQLYDHNVDIYSLGLVMYWLLNEKRMPFVPLPPAVPTYDQEEEAKYRRLKGDKIPAPKYGSTELKKIVLTACGADRKMRYQSASEMLKDLELLGSSSAAKHNETSFEYSAPSDQADSVSDNRDDSDSTIGTGNPQSSSRVDGEYSISCKKCHENKEESTLGNSYRDDDDGETVASSFQSKQNNQWADNSSMEDLFAELFGGKRRDTSNPYVNSTPGVASVNPSADRDNQGTQYKQQNSPFGNVYVSGSDKDDKTVGANRNTNASRIDGGTSYKSEPPSSSGKRKNDETIGAQNNGHAASKVHETEFDSSFTGNAGNPTLIYLQDHIPVPKYSLSSIIRWIIIIGLGVLSVFWHWGALLWALIILCYALKRVVLRCQTKITRNGDEIYVTLSKTTAETFWKGCFANTDSYAVALNGQWIKAEDGDTSQWNPSKWRTFSFPVSGYSNEVILATVEKNNGTPAYKTKFFLKKVL